MEWIPGASTPVALILQCIASGMTVEDIIKGYPTLKRKAILAALGFAARQMDGEEARILEKV